MKRKLIIVGVVTFLLVDNWAFANENETAVPQELGIEQKLARIYELYQKGDIVSLKSKEMQGGISIGYSINDRETLGIRESSRTLTTQLYLSRGFGKGIEISVVMPYFVNSETIETVDSILARQSVSGLGDPTIRLIKEVPSKEASITIITAASFPWGKDRFSHDETHISLGINLNKILRPAFIFGGVTGERDWESRTNGIGYRAGLGFFLNHFLSVGTEFAGVLVLNPKIGEVRDSLTTGIKVAYQARPNLGIVAMINSGQTSDVPQTTLGITTYWRF